ncbi:Protein BIG GRAIN 1-like B [Euphorbia peplus]|nr:Protein BIG GRAIN 1-like B [Euphorbia peplus]
MDHKIRRHSQQHYQREIENPSFSSTLLDAIYRSIDESNGTIDDEMVFYHGEKSKKTNKGMMIEKWIEEKNTYEKVSVRRKSMADFDRKSITNQKNSHSHSRPQPMLLNSSSSSSESSCGGGFSSSESESIRPKPIRTSNSGLGCSDRGEQIRGYRNSNYGAPQYDGVTKYESGFMKTKSKAMKLYGDLKKVKQPISPGGRLATFLNSIFTAGAPKNEKNSKNVIKKPKISSSYDDRKIKSEQNSTCSSASSFSRSCLSKTPSCRNGNKRSVRFFPVSVIVGEDSRPCGHKNVYENSMSHSNSNSGSNMNSINEQLKFRVVNESRRVEEVARELLKNYQKKKQEEEEEDDDVASCASSDLFELDNLAAIGINEQRYREELPVYETTNLGTNRAIANGLFM